MARKAEPPLRLPARYYARLGKVLLALGVDVQQVLRDARLAPRHLTSPDASLSLEQAERLCSSALHHAPRADLGLLLGRSIEPASHETLGLAMLRSDSLDAALRLASRYFSLLTPGFRLRYSLGSDHAVAWIYPQLPFSGDVLRLHLETVLVAFVGELRHLHGKPLPRLDVQIAIARPAYAGRYRSLTQVRCRFAADSVPGLRIYMPSALMRLPRCIDTGVDAQLALQRCDSLLQRVRLQGRVAQWTRMMLRESQGGMPRQEELAALLAVSSRTYARLLAAEGGSYRASLLAVRDELACRELARPELSITAIASQLGYRDCANFSRAFRRRHGRTPREMRGRARHGQT